ncbi:purine-uracil permease NCS1 [Cinnamomum micranthum f. kanehirae]|uniref:Purine-uracil permease NCS1 n=1 Tax=Cinnamomum micranthum f. kanehirae TaxID=337451 RepID=A0A443PSS0_9MAGN|nr:purine-uracil permease NCS1 [Cinnamomum micranthum f. kanehirae]
MPETSPSPSSLPLHPTKKIISNLPLINHHVFKLSSQTMHDHQHHSFQLLLQQRKFSTSIASKRPTSGSEFKSDSDADATLTNDDLKPTAIDQRTFSGWEMASLWVGLVVGVPSYYLAGSLVDLGMAWWQGIATVVAANIILLIPLMLTGHPGTRYGISFPVLARSAFGIRGAHVPTLLRALVGCGWYGIESWIGGEAVFLLLPASLKKSKWASYLPWLGTSPLEFACFIFFWLAQLTIIWKGMDGIRDLEKYSAPILIVLTSSLLCWAYIKAANISFWATLALNIPDFTRFAKSQTDQVVGQAGLPIFMGLFTFVGLAVTSSTEVIFGRVISSPIQLLGEIGGAFTVFLAIFGISLATITTNIAANIVAPANALVNLSPTKFSFRRGALLTAILGIVFQPWRLLRSSESFVYTWLVSYSALLGPIGGIVLVDYYLIRRTVLDVNALYSTSPRGAYYYFKGFNVAALVALIVGILPVIPGFLHTVGILKSVADVSIVIYNNAWFVSFFFAGTVYWFLSLLRSNGESSQLIDPLLDVSN